MSTEYITVTTQAELDRAVADGNIPICKDGFFSASGSATVRASDSATVRAFDSATVEAFDSATVEAFGSATVRAFGSATVEASGSATVRAFDSATVRAFDSATVRASGSATVEASKFVAVQRHGETAKVNGGVLIQIPVCDTPADWLDFYGIETDDGHALLFKAVDKDFRSAHGAVYKPGETTTCDDWSAVAACGNGLHFGPRPFMAARYAPVAERYMACRVRVADIVVIGGYGGVVDKCKAPSCLVLHEVDVDGEPLVAAEVAA